MESRGDGSYLSTIGSFPLHGSAQAGGETCQKQEQEQEHEQGQGKKLGLKQQVEQKLMRTFPQLSLLQEVGASRRSSGKSWRESPESPGSSEDEGLGSSPPLSPTKYVSPPATLERRRSRSGEQDLGYRSPPPRRLSCPSVAPLVQRPDQLSLQRVNSAPRILSSFQFCGSLSPPRSRLSPSGVTLSPPRKLSPPSASSSSLSPPSPHPSVASRARNPRLAIQGSRGLKLRRVEGLRINSQMN